MINRYIALTFLFLFSTSTFAADSTFTGLGFGVGVSLTEDMGSTDRVEEAQIIDNIVRIDWENNSRARLMLESHYFFTPGKADGGFWGVKNGDWGFGPFIALQAGSDEIIEAVAAGFMFGIRRKRDGNNDSASQSSSWNFGIGIVVDPKVKTLGDGFTPNAAPPGSETAVRYKEKSQRGLLFITSFSF